MKPRLILVQIPYQSESLFHSSWFKNIINDHFQVEHYQYKVKYPSDSVFVIGCNHYLNNDLRPQFEHRRVIVDALWESNTGKWAGCFHNTYPNHLILYGNQENIVDPKLHYVPNWFWYNESLWYLERGYHKFFPKRSYIKKFLMPLGKSRGWRTELVDSLGARLDDALWSYTCLLYTSPSPRD